jgi:hypothetical protein
MKTYRFFSCNVVVFLAVVALFIGCFSFHAGQGRSRTDTQWTFLEPEDVVGKKLVGSDEEGEYSFLLNEGGTLEYTINGTVNIGTWSFDAFAAMYRYAFEWTEDGKDQGYLIEILLDGTRITITGHWFLTDDFITFRKDATFEQQAYFYN